MTLVLLFAVTWTGLVDHVDAVEINRYGTDHVRVALIYRDADGLIVAWRWFTTNDQIPRPVRRGLYVAVWDDAGTPRTVYCRRVFYIRSDHDIEMSERAVLPHHKRRHLSRRN